MDWRNCFTIRVCVALYSYFQMAYEVIEKQPDYEHAYNWFHSKQKAEEFYMRELVKKS